MKQMKSQICPIKKYTKRVSYSNSINVLKICNTYTTKFTGIKSRNILKDVKGIKGYDTKTASLTA